MSTKIYNGIIFKHRTYKNVIKNLIEAKEKFLKSDEIKNEENTMLSYINDFVTGVEDKTNNWSWRKALDAFTDKGLLDLYRRGVYIYYDDVTNRYYGYYIGEVEYKSYKHLTKDYHYQNQSDQPEDISEEKWEERENVWDRLLPGAGHLNERGSFFLFWDPEKDYEYGVYSICSRLAKAYKEREVVKVNLVYDNPVKEITISGTVQL